MLLQQKGGMAWQAGLAALSLSCGVPALAHHSQAAFDASQVISFEGRVHRLDWKNPHIYLIVETQGSDGQPLLQQIEGLAVTQALVDGLDREALAPGTQVIVRANPNRGGEGKTVRGLNVSTLDDRVHPFYERAAERRALEAAESLAGKWAPSLAETSRMFAQVGGWALTDAARSGELVGACEIEPVPFLTVINELRVIELEGDRIIMRHDNSGDIGVRSIHLDRREHPADLQPSLFGHSIGRWEDGSLVIDTVGYAAHASGLFSGIPAGTGKHSVERLTLSEDRRQLLYEFTMEDPDYLEAPISFSMLWDHRPDLELSNEPCDPEISDRYLAE